MRDTLLDMHRDSDEQNTLQPKNVEPLPSAREVGPSDIFQIMFGIGIVLMIFCGVISLALGLLSFMPTASKSLRQYRGVLIGAGALTATVGSLLGGVTLFKSEGGTLVHTVVLSWANGTSTAAPISESSNPPLSANAFDCGEETSERIKGFTPGFADLGPVLSQLTAYEKKLVPPRTEPDWKLSALILIGSADWREPRVKLGKPYRSNFALAQARANEVRKWLIANVPDAQYANLLSLVRGPSAFGKWADDATMSRDRAVIICPIWGRSAHAIESSEAPTKN